MYEIYKNYIYKEEKIKSSMMSGSELVHWFKSILVRNPVIKNHEFLLTKPVQIQYCTEEKLK